MRRAARLLALALLLVFPLLATAPAARASMVGKRLVGTVTDSGGKPLEGVRVKLFNIGGVAPEYSIDRSAVNARGLGQWVPHGTRATEIPFGAPAARDQVATTTTDDKGFFSFVPTSYVDAVLVELDRPGFELEMVRLHFPKGTTQKTFTLHPSGEAAATTAPEVSAKEKAATYFDRGNAYAKARQWTEAQAAFAEAVKLAPELDTAWLNLAIAGMQLGDHAGALAAAERLLALAPDHRVARMLAADARAALGPGAAKPSATPERKADQADAKPEAAASADVD